MSRLLEGKSGIVTGAGRGIGRSIALLLASEGCRVVVNDLGGSLSGVGGDASPAEEVVAEIKALGGDAVADHGDVSKWADAQALVERAIGEFGDLHVLINNAGVVRTAMSFNMEEADWDLVVGVHLKGTFATSRFAAEYWRSRSKAGTPSEGAVIVNTSSPNGLNGGMPGHVNYAAAKSGIATMTITLARELAPYGVRCNAVAPVAFTRMTESLWGSEGFTEDRREAYSPEAMAAVVGWLASPHASDVSGQVVGVYGTELRLWESWRTVTSAVAPGTRWTLEGVQSVRDRLFDGVDPGVPPER